MDHPSSPSSPATASGSGRDNAMTYSSSSLSSWEHREERVASTTLEKYHRLYTMLITALVSSSLSTSMIIEAAVTTTAVGSSGSELFGDDGEEEDEEEELEI